MDEIVVLIDKKLINRTIEDFLLKKQHSAPKND